MSIISWAPALENVKHLIQKNNYSQLLLQLQENKLIFLLHDSECKHIFLKKSKWELIEELKWIIPDSEKTHDPMILFYNSKRFFSFSDGKEQRTRNMIDENWNVQETLSFEKSEWNLIKNTKTGLYNIFSPTQYSEPRRENIAYKERFEIFREADDNAKAIAKDKNGLFMLNINRDHSVVKNYYENIEPLTIEDKDYLLWYRSLPEDKKSKYRKEPKKWDSYEISLFKSEWKSVWPSFKFYPILEDGKLPFDLKDIKKIVSNMWPAWSVYEFLVETEEEWVVLYNTEFKRVDIENNHELFDVFPYSCKFITKSDDKYFLNMQVPSDWIAGDINTSEIILDKEWYDEYIWTIFHKLVVFRKGQKFHLHSLEWSTYFEHQSFLENVDQFQQIWTNLLLIRQDWETYLYKNWNLIETMKSKISPTKHYTNKEVEIWEWYMYTTWSWRNELIIANINNWYWYHSLDFTDVYKPKHSELFRENGVTVVQTFRKDGIDGTYEVIHVTKDIEWKLGYKTINVIPEDIEDKRIVELENFLGDDNKET